MFERHLSGNLAALLDGQLAASEAARAEAHLAGCGRCRSARQRFQFSASMLEQLPVVEAPASVWKAIERELPGLKPNPVLATGRWPMSAALRPSPALLALAATLLLAAAVGVIWQLTRTPAEWDVVRLDGPRGGHPLIAGEWIETDAGSRASIKIGQIGTVDIAPNTRMQLLAARPDEHRLNLAHGMISAQILAPPRLFFVETPSSTVVDLGCAYTMQVDQAGVGLLRVTSGWASLEWGGRESIVPAGASCPTRPEIGPGTPSFDDASERLRQGLVAFDFDNGGSSALDVVLSEARDRDTLTLWHLLSRVDAGDRARVFDRMVALTPLPNGVTREKALALEPETLKLWREELAWTW